MTKAQMTLMPSLPVPSPSDQRGAERAALMLRTAKLICQSGEYVCMVRDISSGGVKVRLFHALPPETFVFLEMANGELYPMENKWHRGDEAGFRFVQPIDVDQFIEESGIHSRRPIRLRVEAHGRLFCAGRSTPVILRDLSQGGARIETTTWLALHQPVRLVIDGLPESVAQVRWRNRYDHGLAFERTFRLEELADHARKLQPFVPQPLLAIAEPAAALQVRANG